jgi:hypothetical protein
VLRRAHTALRRSAAAQLMPASSLGRPPAAAAAPSRHPAPRPQTCTRSCAACCWGCRCRTFSSRSTCSKHAAACHGCSRARPTECAASFACCWQSTRSWLHTHALMTGCWSAPWGTLAHPLPFPLHSKLTGRILLGTAGPHG